MNKKNILIISLASLFTLIGIFNVTYAYFNAKKYSPITLSSANSFGTSIVNVVTQNSDISGSLPSYGKVSQNKVTASLSTENSYASYVTSLIASVNPNDTTFLNGSASALKYEIYHKTDNNLDTSSASCVSNSYSILENNDYCTTGTFEGKLDGAPFEMMSNYNIGPSSTHYFDIYIWVSGDETGDEVADKRLKVNYFFVTTASINE